MNKVAKLDNYQNPDLKNTVDKNNSLKDFLVEYVGRKLNSADVTVEMIVDVMSKEFPEFLLVIAEENFIRGYEQAMIDIDDDEDNKKNKKRK